MVPGAHAAPRAGRAGAAPRDSNLHLSIPPHSALTDLEAPGPPRRCPLCPSRRSKMAMDCSKRCRKF